MDLQTKIFSRSLGTEVTNHNGERIGRVTEVKKDAAEEKIEYLVICSSELFGNGNRYFAVPACSSLLNVTEEGKILLYMDKDSLQVATGIHARDCPKTNPTFSESILELYHYESSKTRDLNLPESSLNDNRYA